MAYLITCSGSKQCPIAGPSSLQNLSFPELNIQREEIIRLSEIQLDWERTLPAWELYSGNYSKLYPKVLSINWLKPCAEIKILSALFGWIKHTDRIPYYNLQMTDRIGANQQRVWIFWYNFYVLQNYVGDTDIDLLSIGYRKAINKTGIPVANVPSVNFTDRGGQKGKWLNNELSLLDC